MKTFKQFLEQAYQAPPPVPAQIRPAQGRNIPHPEMRRKKKVVNSKFKSPFKTETDKGTEESMLPGMGLVGAAIRKGMKKKDKKPKLKPYQIQPKSKTKIKLEHVLTMAQRS